MTQRQEDTIYNTLTVVASIVLFSFVWNYAVNLNYKNNNMKLEQEKDEQLAALELQLLQLYTEYYGLMGPQVRSMSAHLTNTRRQSGPQTILEHKRQNRPYVGNSQAGAMEATRTPLTTEQIAAQHAQVALVQSLNTVSPLHPLPAVEPPVAENKATYFAEIENDIKEGNSLSGIADKYPKAQLVEYGNYKGVETEGKTEKQIIKALKNVIAQ